MQLNQRLPKIDSFKKDFKRLLYHYEVWWLSLGKCLMRFATLFDRVVEFLRAKHEELKEKLSSQKTLKFSGMLIYSTCPCNLMI